VLLCSEVLDGRSVRITKPGNRNVNPLAFSTAQALAFPSAVHTARATARKPTLGIGPPCSFCFPSHLPRGDTWADRSSRISGSASSNLPDRIADSGCPTRRCVLHLDEAIQQNLGRFQLDLGVLVFDQPPQEATAVRFCAAEFASRASHEADTASCSELSVN